MFAESNNRGKTREQTCEGGADHHINEEKQTKTQPVLRAQILLREDPPRNKKSALKSSALQRHDKEPQNT